MEKQLLGNSFDNNILIARGKVRHITGGPDMTLAGFIHPIAFEMFSAIKGELTREQNHFLAEKICISEEKKIGFYPKLGSTTFYGHIWNQNGVLSEWYYPGTYTISFKCLCRYYTQKEEEFIYKLFSPLELEFCV
jgi:hypothetical protein